MQNMDPIRFLDLRITDPEELAELRATFESHCQSGRFLLSDDFDELEKVMALRIGRKHCVGVNTGTDALVTALQLLNLPANSYVLTSPFSWIASSSAIFLAGLKPLYVDITDDLQLDLELAVKAIESNRFNITAILIPHLHGNVSSLKELVRIREEFDVRIVEDCAQAFGARDEDGNLAGSVGDVSSFSFNPMKVLGALGDAGALLFDEEIFLERAKRLRHSGIIGTNGIATEISRNYRLDALQASFLVKRIKYFERHLEKRRELSRIYDREIGRFVKSVTINTSFSNHYCYQTIVSQRDELAAHLTALGIEVRIRHKLLIPEHPAFASEKSTELSNSKRLIGMTLCLPMHHQLSDYQIERVCDSVVAFFSCR